jgi:hypothetical protein
MGMGWDRTGREEEGGRRVSRGASAHNINSTAMSRSKTEQSCNSCRQSRHAYCRLRPPSIDVNNRTVHMHQLVTEFTLKQLHNVGRVGRERHANDVICISGGSACSHGIDKGSRNL